MAAPMWHYALHGQQFGPVPEEQLKHLIATAQLSPADLVWRDGLPNWLPIHSIPELAPSAAAAPVIGYYYHNAAPKYAGFWLRFFAILIDGLLFFLAGCILGTLFTTMPAAVHQPGPANLLQLLISWLYFAILESSSKQATLGKMALGIYVTDLDCRRLSFGRATGRFFAKQVASLPMFAAAVLVLIFNRTVSGPLVLLLLIVCLLIWVAAFAMAGFTERKQALHDLLAGTLVLRR